MSQPKTILVVEDNAKNMRLMKMLLQRQHYSIIEATDGCKAFDVLKKQKPHLIIMDIQLPKMCGLEVIEKIKASPAMSKIPIIVLTAYARQEEKNIILAAGCSLYISKPVNIHSLLKAVNSLIAAKGP